MATEASRIAVIISAMTETLQFLKEHPENLNFLDPLLPAFRITRRAIANFGKELPKKDMEWCQKWQTIEHADESTPDATTPSTMEAITQDDSSTRDTTTQDDPVTTDAATEDNSSTADAATQDSCSTTDGITQGDSSTADTTTQASSSTVDTQDDTFATQDTSIVNKKQRIYKFERCLIDDEVIAKFKGRDKDFTSYTHQPDSFWNLSTTQPNAFPNERSFFENTAKQPLNINNLKFIHRLDSVIAYLRYKKRLPQEQRIRLRKLKIFLQEIGIPTEKASKQQEMLQSGRRRLEFCHSLSKINAKFPQDCYDDINFDDVDYGFLFLDLDDKIWSSVRGRDYDLMLKTIEDLDLRGIISISEQCGAKDAAKALLQYRQTSIENQTPPPSNNKENNSTTVQSDVEGSSSIVVSEDPHTEDHLDNTRALKRPRTEDHLDRTASKRLCIEENPDGTTASEHARTEENPDGTTASEHARTEENPDGTTASEHARTEENPDGTTASEHARTEENPDGTTASEHPHTNDNLEMLLQAAAFTGQNADTSETTITNLGLPMEHLDSEMMMEELGNTAAFGLGFNEGQPTFFDDADIDELYAQYGMQFSDGILCTYDIQLPELKNIG